MYIGRYRSGGCLYGVRCRCFGDRCIKGECMCSGKCEDAVCVVVHLGEVYTQWNM